MTDAYDRLEPPNLSQTLRSLPRRLRGPLLAGEDLLEDEAAVAGPAGESALEILDDLAWSLMVLDAALEQTLLHDEPVLPAAVTDRAARASDQPAPTLPVILAALDEVLADLADRIDGADGGDWGRGARVAGGGSITALAIARESARTGVERLHDLERLMTGSPD